MKLSMLVNPFNELNLQLAAQVGVSEIVLSYPGLDLKRLLAAKALVESCGMRLTHIERKIPHLKFVHNLQGRDEQIRDFQTLIRNMGEAGLEVLCYNWMPDEDWQRTSAEVRERGGARVTEFNLANVGCNVTDASGYIAETTPAAKLWENLEYFLQQVIPVAEEAGVRLALHPDDPPLPVLLDQPRIMISNEALRRVVELVPSPSNGICYCVGSLYPAGVDVLAGIHALADKIVFFHARNVRGTAAHFVETWHDNGEIDMSAVIRALIDIGYTGTLRTDHAPSMAGETNETPGYEVLGGLFATGYIRGLLHGINGASGHSAVGGSERSA